jgi:hypothetical protein
VVQVLAADNRVSPIVHLQVKTCSVKTSKPTLAIAVHAAASVLPGKYVKTVVVNLGPMDVALMRHA